MTTLQIKKKVHDLEFSAEEKRIIHKRTKELKSGKDKGMSLAETVKYAKATINKF